MQYWWTVICYHLLIPVLMLVGGYFMWKVVPKKSNRFLGYRTARSMKSEESWNFANHHCGRIWWIVGWVMLIPNLIEMGTLVRTQEAAEDLSVVILLVQLAILLISLIPTQVALKKNFDPEGKPLK